MKKLVGTALIGALLCGCVFAGSAVATAAPDHSSPAVASREQITVQGPITAITNAGFNVGATDDSGRVTVFFVTDKTLFTNGIPHQGDYVQVVGTSNADNTGYVANVVTIRF
ncbi:MAG: hypothetical protein JOZ47_11285 [Kutzneria sp.]|nr:hypothetical protein [Kutzneria sp.]MBV9845644.1 hypothetical protein [Kutzneria sp.]